MRARAYRDGIDITLSSGKRSDFYINGKKISLDPEGLYLMARLMLDQLAELPEVTAIGGLTLGADPIAAAICALSHETGQNLRAFMVRKEPKGHGLKLWVEGRGNLQDGDRVCIVEDTVTTGGSLLRAIEHVEASGLVVAQVVVVVDREEGARERIAEAGYDMEALVGRAELLGEG